MESIKIDAFNTNLHGCKILCQGPFPNKKYAPILESIQKLREPFKKKILITKAAFSFSKYLPLQYDVTFQVKESIDWTLVLTYITYAPKPLLVVVEDVQIPDALWQKINRATTFINISSSMVLNIRPYDAIFFAPIEEVGTSFTEYVYKILQSVFKATYTQKEHKEIVTEIRVAGAGIAWTRHEEDVAGGSIYWYDPITKAEGDGLNNKQMAELFSFLADHYA